MKSRSNNRIVLIVCAAFQLFSACKLSKDVPVINAGLPVSYRNGQSDSASIALMPWAEFFEDDALKILINDALSHNNDLQIAVKNIETAALTLRQARLGNLPNLGFQIGAVSNRPSDNSLNGLTLEKFLQTKHIEDYTLGPVLSWEADLWGKIRSRKEIALAEFFQTQEAKNVVQTRIVSDISKGYYNLLMLDAQLEIARKTVLLYDSTLTIVNLQYHAGQVTSLAVQQAQAQQLTAKKLVPQFEQQIIIQENAISILTGKNPEAIPRTINLDSININGRINAGIPSGLLSRRPDVKLSELAFSRANANVGYAKASMYPSLIITAQSGLNAFKASNWFNIPASLFGTVAAGLSQPLLQQRRYRTQYEVAQVNRDQTVIQFRQTVLTAVGEVSDALVKINKLAEQQNLAYNRTNMLLQATRNSRLLFGNGLANYLEVITAQGNVLQSELELSSLKKARLDATVDLYRSVGGGWN